MPICVPSLIRGKTQNTPGNHLGAQVSQRSGEIGPEISACTVSAGRVLMPERLGRHVGTCS